MTEDKNDVDLYKELEDELAKSEEDVASGASADKNEDDDKSKVDVKDENAELSEEEISKLSPRAQKRIREQAAEIKRLSEKEISDKPTKEIVDESKPHEFKDVDEFLNAVQDPDSKKLLENFAKVLKKETSTTLAPVEKANNEARFETTFDKYTKIDGIADYKNDLKKTFLNDPKQDIDALVSKVVTDLALRKIKKTDETVSAPNRGGEVDLDSMGKDDLYSTLEGMKGK